MDKRYQVFVSSTFEDLKEERGIITQTLMKIDCIPAGMELFPAADMQQWDFIKKVIDDSDYYILVIGGRYGSISDKDISFTEMEYNYAVERGIKVIALIHRYPDSLPVSATDKSDDLRGKLSRFRNKVSKNRLVEFWERSDELAGLVALSVPQTIKIFPAVGWIRADQTTSKEILLQLNNLRQENEELKKEISNIKLNKSSTSYSLADGNDKILIRGEAKTSLNSEIREWECLVSWDYIKRTLGPKLLLPFSETSVRDYLSKSIMQSVLEDYAKYSSIKIVDEVMQLIKLQLMALNFIMLAHRPLKSSTITQWCITSEGKQHLFELATAKKVTDEKRKS